MTRLIDLAAEAHGCNRVEIVVALGVTVARIERITNDTTAATLESVLPVALHNAEKAGRDGVSMLAAELRTRSARQLGRDHRAVEDARAALVAAEARAAKTAALVDQLAALADGGTDG
jgi:hypothetical protein